MAVNFWNFWKWLEITGNGGTWLEIAEHGLK